jgi:hypothetical protein
LFAAVAACYSISFRFEAAAECVNASEIGLRGAKESVGDWALRDVSDEEMNDIRAAVESIAGSHGLEKHQIKEQTRRATMGNIGAIPIINDVNDVVVLAAVNMWGRSQGMTNASVSSINAVLKGRNVNLVCSGSFCDGSFCDMASCRRCRRYGRRRHCPSCSQRHFRSCGGRCYE